MGDTRLFFFSHKYTTDGGREEGGFYEHCSIFTNQTYDMKSNELLLILLLMIRGVQIRSESDPNPIRSDSFGLRNKNIDFGSDRIGKVVS